MYCASIALNSVHVTFFDNLFYVIHVCMHFEIQNVSNRISIVPLDSYSCGNRILYLSTFY